MKPIAYILLVAMLFMLNNAVHVCHAQSVSAALLDLKGKGLKDVIHALGEPSQARPADNLIGYKFRNAKASVVLVYEVPKVLVVLDERAKVLVVRAHDKGAEQK